VTLLNQTTKARSKMTTLTEIQFVAQKIKSITGAAEDFAGIIAEHGELIALKILGHAYYTACKTTNSPISKVNCIQNILDIRAADDEMAAKYDI
jgi:hypothetical protein